MKKIIILSGILLLATVNSAHAGIFSRIFGIGNLNNGYYYSPNYHYTNGSYYRPPRYNNYYNNYNNRYYRSRNPYGYSRYRGNHYRKPVIYRTNIRRSSLNSNEKLVRNYTSDLERLEQKILLQNYEYDSPKNRVERLEQRIFGASQTGDLQNRISVLKSAAKNYKVYNPDGMREYSNYSAETAYRPPVFSGTSGAGLGNTLWGNFKNQFIGMPTGFTPAMDPAYMDYFEAERALSGNGESVDVRTNRGYYRSNTNRGMTTGVTILD